MAQPLTRTQITSLAIEARKAFDTLDASETEAIRARLAAKQEDDGDPFACAATVKATAVFEAWRREQTAAALKAAGKKPTDSFKALTQNDFLWVRAHFVRFCDPEAAAKIAQTALDDDRKRFLWVIEQECKKSGWMRFPDYPQGICRSQYGCRLESAHIDQLRRILFTVRTRAKNHHEKA